MRFKYYYSDYELDIFGDSVVINDSLKLEYKRYIINETEKALDEPVKNILAFFSNTAEIHISEKSTITIEELKKRIENSKCKTVEDFYNGLGFKVYEVFVNDERYFSKELTH